VTILGIVDPKWEGRVIRRGTQMSSETRKVVLVVRVIAVALARRRLGSSP